MHSSQLLLMSAFTMLTPKQKKISIAMLASAGVLMLAQAPVRANAQTAQTGERADVTIQRFLDREIASATNLGQLPQANAGRIEINVGQIDSRLTLAPCARVEPSLPSNARLWGRVNVMIRCVEGANWNVALPVTVRVFGNALVASRALQANEPVGAADTMVQEVELSRDAGTPVSMAEQLEQRVLSRPVANGAVLRQEWFRAMPVIAAGDQVRILATGNGFAISGEGQALNQAAEGQTVRVRTETGRVVSGTARSGRIAEIKI
jgi:flagellar basal body P-ring formation protein FlgA